MTFVMGCILAIASLLSQPLSGASHTVPARADPDSSRDSRRSTLHTSTDDGRSSGAPLSGSGQLGTVLLAGGANFAEPSHGPNYLAMRLDRGTRVRICGVTCRVMTVNDYGPKNEAKVADIALVRFTAICGFASQQAARAAGICPIEVEVLPHITLPPTDTEE